MIDRLRDERGIALLMALGVLVVTSIMMVSIVTYSSSSSRASSSSKASQVAYALAEAGINNAMAVLSLPSNNALDQCLLHPPTPTSCASNTPFTSAYEGGTVSWYGILNTNTEVWSLTAVGKVRNPTGAATVTRTITASVQVISTLTQPLNNSAWNYIYATKTGDPDGCDEELNNSATFSANLYVDGNLCLDNTATITRDANYSVTLVVKGLTNLKKSGNAIGASGTTSPPLIDEAHLVGGCKLQNNAVHNPCGTADHVYVKNLYNTVQSITAPTADWDYWYQYATLGPKHPCDNPTSGQPTFESAGNTARDNSVTPVFNLVPSTSYTCRHTDGAGNIIGELSWDASAKILTLRGVVFFDGGITFNTGSTVQYRGQGSLYVSGTVTMVSGLQLCGGISGGNCDFTAWSPNNDMMMLVIKDMANTGTSLAFTQSARFQGGVYASTAVTFAQNGQIEGPMVATELTFSNSVVAHSFPLITQVPIGTPGNPNSYADPQPPGNFSG